MKITTVNLTDAQYKVLQALAEKEYVSISGAIRHIITKYLDDLWESYKFFEMKPSDFKQILKVLR